jgi:hypothetical protein
VRYVIGAMDCAVPRDCIAVGTSATGTLLVYRSQG